MIDIKNLVSQNKIHFIYGSIILVLIAGFVMRYKFSQNSTSPPPVATITDKTPASVAKGQAAVGKYTGKEDAADVSQLIEQAVKKPADVTFYTSNQKDADKQAQELAKVDKADYMLKEAAEPNFGPGDSQQIQNNYYAIQQERKHRLAAGVTAIDGKAYATVAYTNDRLTYELHSKDLKNIDGGSVLYTVKKW